MESKSQYRPLAADGEYDSDCTLCSRCRGQISGDRFSKYKSLAIFEICQVLVALLGLGAYTLFWRDHGQNGPDRYLDMANYNLSRLDFGIQNAADASEAADLFWEGITNSTGIVALDNKWAESMDLPPTVPHPHQTGYNLYQVNTFHSLHCLYHIRNRLVSEVPLEKWPRNGIHTMHCLDHIREDLMCNTDITLRGSEDYVSFGTKAPKGEKCRDLDALQSWAFEHEWTGYFDYLYDELEIHPAAMEKDAMEQKKELEKELGRKIRYDELKVDYDWDTMRIKIGVS